jgi:hypothetical protein
LNILFKDEIERAFPKMPEGTLCTFTLDKPGDAYILCIGNVNDSDFFVVSKQPYTIAMATKLNVGNRVHLWVHHRDLAYLYESQLLHSLTTACGRVESSVWVCLEPKIEKYSDLQEKVLSSSHECSIKEGQIFVKCLLHDFSSIITEHENLIESFEIVDL